MYQLRSQRKLSLISKLEIAVLGVGTEGIYLGRADAVVYLHRCPKLEVTIDENGFCT